MQVNKVDKISQFLSVIKKIKLLGHNSKLCKRLALLTSSLGILLYGSSAYAYLDPATGSMILQGLMAGIAVVAMTVKLYWYKVVGFFKKTDIDSDEEFYPDEDNKASQNQETKE